MPATRSRLGVIFLTVLIDLIGFGIVLPILPGFAQRFGAQGIGYGALVFVFPRWRSSRPPFSARCSVGSGGRPFLSPRWWLNAAGSWWLPFAPPSRGRSS